MCRQYTLPLIYVYTEQQCAYGCGAHSLYTDTQIHRQASSQSCMFHYVCAYVTYNKITNLRVSTHRHGHICDWNTTVTLAVEDDAAITSLFISFASKIHLQGSHVGMKLFICSGANLQTCMPNTRRRQDQIDVQCCALCSYRSTQDASAGI